MNKKINTRDGDEGYCEDCSIDTFKIDEYYMIKNDIWEKVAPDDTEEVIFYLCISCLEKRLGRTLTREDFPMDIPANWKGEHSKRLKSRMKS